METPTRLSVTIPCASGFKSRVEALATARGCTVGDIVRAGLVLMPPTLVRSMEDPGEPLPEDREEILIQSGQSRGRRLKRKPRLQMRLDRRVDPATVRKILALSLDIASGNRRLSLFATDTPSPEEQLSAERERAQRFQAIVSAISFTPLKAGVKSRHDALYVLGFGPGDNPSADLIREKFKMLAMIYHPDSPWAGDHKRMSQINAAMQYLKRTGTL